LVMESIMLSLSRPTRRAFNAFREVVDNRDNSGKPYPVPQGQNSSLWDERDNLVALRRQAGEDRLSVALRKHFPFLFKSEKYSSGRIARYSEKRLRKVVVC
jgi:hypothetical protein